MIALMKSLDRRLKWGWHISIVAMVTYELCTIEESEIFIGNWLLVFSLVGLITTFLSTVFLGFQFGVCISRTVINAVSRLNKQNSVPSAQDRGSEDG